MSKWKLATSSLLVVGCYSGVTSETAGFGDGTAGGTAGASVGSDSGASEGDASSSGAADGAGSTTSPSGDYHPAGFADPAMHGPALKFHEQDCRSCHGNELDGGTVQVSCDSCHEPTWRTDCTYCHGGEIDQSGAPPRDLDGTTDPTQLSFIAHTAHVGQNDHPAYGCEQCHVKPDDVLTMDHVFDATDHEAEVVFSAGLSGQGSWNDGTCSQLYCHGNGQGDNGSYQHDAGTPDCGGCHSYPGTGNTDFGSMSGHHRKHMNEGIDCQECHALTDAGGSIGMAILHVNGTPDVAIDALDYDEGTGRCSGQCHGENHNDRDW